MAKPRETYICTACGARALQWQGQCPACKEWNTLELSVLPRETGRGATARVVQSRPMALRDVPEQGMEPFGTGLDALDRILGKGFVPGAAVLIGGEPGIGKSTLLLQLAGAVAASGRDVLYLSGEESLPQIKGRAERLGALHPALMAVATSRV